jgi:uncharacterized membrane protein
VERHVRDFVNFLIPIVDAIGATVISVGVLLAFGGWLLSELRLRRVSYESIRLLLGRFLALGLEFQLGADLLGTAVRPSYSEIGKLGAVAAIRTGLNYFLALELRRAQSTQVGEQQMLAPSGSDRP